MDDNGIDTEKITEICKRENVRGIYIIPHHHYPTTVTLSPERRIKMLSLAKKYNFIIIEDDYDYDFHYSSAPYLPMASYSHDGRVIYIGSLSKCFSSALRLGFIVAPDDLINAVTHLRKTIDIRGDILMEHSLAGLFETGEIQRHLRKSIKIYKERRDYMCAQIDTYLKNYVSYQVPSGGMAIWIKFKPDYLVERVASLLEKQGIAFSNNILFSQHDLNSIRLGFASLNFKEIDFCIKGIKTAIKQYSVIS
jgi:GntR family transcriptional regulator/MocR family aminotransferase